MGSWCLQKQVHRELAPCFPPRGLLMIPIHNQPNGYLELNMVVVQQSRLHRRLHRSSAATAVMQRRCVQGRRRFINVQAHYVSHLLLHAISLSLSLFRSLLLSCRTLAACLRPQIKRSEKIDLLAEGRAFSSRRRQRFAGRWRWWGTGEGERQTGVSSRQDQTILSQTREMRLI